VTAAVTSQSIDTGPSEEPRLQHVLRAVSHPVRREILSHLLRAEMEGADELGVTAIARLIEADRFTASHHLACLLECGLVHVRRQKAWRLHSIVLERLAELDDWLYPFMREFDARTGHRPANG
jgi:DNA-binding transcriptional ArsR family regulator